MGIHIFRCKLKTMQGNRKPPCAPTRLPEVSQKTNEKPQSSFKFSKALRPGATHLVTGELENVNQKRWQKVSEGICKVEIIMGLGSFFSAVRWSAYLIEAWVAWWW